MKVLGLLAVVGSVVAYGGEKQAELFPTPEGASWTFRVTSNTGAAAVTTQMVARVTKTPKDAAVFFGEDIQDREAREGATLIEFSGRWEEPLLIERAADGALKIAVEPFAGRETFAARWSIPAGVKPGASWKGFQLYPSCGFMPIEATFSAKLEKVTVPAGTFEALRIDADVRWRGTPQRESLWLVRGLGPVKLHRVQSTYELTATSLKAR